MMMDGDPVVQVKTFSSLSLHLMQNKKQNARIDEMKKESK